MLNPIVASRIGQVIMHDLSTFPLSLHTTSHWHVVVFSHLVDVFEIFLEMNWSSKVLKSRQTVVSSPDSMLIQVAKSINWPIISIYWNSISHLTYARGVSLVRLGSLLVGFDHASEDVGLRAKAVVLLLLPLRLIVILVKRSEPVARHLLISCTLSDFRLGTLRCDKFRSLV